MKAICGVLIVFLVISANAQQPWLLNDPIGRWVTVRPMPCLDCVAGWEVVGGVPSLELDTLGFNNMASGTQDKGYFEFCGDGWPAANGFTGEVMWPPSLFTQDMIFGERNRWHYV
jgi:hypothetical protein